MQKYQVYVDFRAAVEQEAMQRAEIQASPEYKSLQDQIDGLIRRQNVMIQGIPDSSLGLEDAKKSLMEEMMAAQTYQFKNAKIKFREKKEVNKDRLINTLDGDLDLFFRLANVTQVALKDHAKGNAKEKELMSCIEVIAKDPVDLVLDLPPL